MQILCTPFRRPSLGPHSPFLSDTRLLPAWQELKLHRNAMIGVFGLMLSVLLFRFRALLVGGKLFDDEHIVVTAAKRPADAGRAPAAKSS
jgi:hypothetical protein